MAERLVLHGRKHLRPEAQELLDLGAPADDLADLRVAITSYLCGDKAAMDRWGASSPAAIEMARKRVRRRVLVDTALWVVVVHEVGEWRGPVFEVFRSCWGPPGSGVAWSPSSGVDPSIPVRRWPDRQLELDLDSGDE